MVIGTNRVRPEFQGFADDVALSMKRSNKYFNMLRSIVFALPFLINLRLKHINLANTIISSSSPHFLYFILATLVASSYNALCSAVYIS